MSTVPKHDGFSAAALGFYLTTNEPVLAAIMATESLPSARSRGGMGIAIYTNSEPQPTMSRQPVLWSLSGVTPNMIGLAGGGGGGRIADAASPAFGLGTVPLAPAHVNMVPGSRYLVWVWCWQTTSGIQPGSIFLAAIEFYMPFVTVDAGPPILIR